MTPNVQGPQLVGAGAKRTRKRSLRVVRLTEYWTSRCAHAVLTTQCAFAIARKMASVPLHSSH